MKIEAFLNYYKLITSAVAGLVIIGTLLYLCFYIAIDKDVLTLNIATLILGIAIGWLIGVLISPYNTDEQTQFLTYTRAISVFVSGYLIAKVDKVVERMLSPDYLFNTITAFRGMSLITAIVVAMLVTFVFRQYHRKKY